MRANNTLYRMQDKTGGPARKTSEAKPGYFLHIKGFPGAETEFVVLCL